MNAHSTTAARQVPEEVSAAADSHNREGKFPLFGIPLALFLAAVALYAPWIGWGVPEATSPDRTKTVATDEILPLEGLAEMHNTFVVSKPDRNYGYPWFHYFETAAFQAPYVVYAKLTGELSSPSPEFPFGFRDPVKALRWLTWIGRLMSVLMGAGIVAAAFVFTRNFWGARAGALAAVLTMLSYPMVYYSRTGNPDVPAAFWTWLGMAVYSAIVRRGFTTKRAAWLGVFAGIAIATKDQSVLFFLPVGVALAVSHPRNWRLCLAALGVSALAYVAAAGMLVDPHRHIEHVDRLLFRTGSTHSMGFYRPGHPKTREGTLATVVEYCQGMSWMLSLPALLAGLAGAAVAARKSRRMLALLAPLALLYFCLALPVRTVVLRYFLPAAPVVCAFAASAVFALAQSRARRAAVPLAALLCGWELAIAADLTYAQAHETRLAASSWFRARVRPGDRIEYFGVREAMPPLPAEIASRRIAGRVEWKKESGHGPRLLRYLADEGPEFLFIAPDVTSKPGAPYSGDCPPEVYDALVAGRTVYVEAAHFSTPSLLPRWFRRPRLDYPSVAPPVRVFARMDILPRLGTPQ